MNHILFLFTFDDTDFKMLGVLDVSNGFPVDFVYFHNLFFELIIESNE